MLKVKMLVCQSRKINFSATDFCAIIWILNQLFAAGWMTYYGVHGDGVKTWWYGWWYRINYKNEKRVRKKEYVYLDLDYSNKIREPYGVIINYKSFFHIFVFNEIASNNMRSIRIFVEDQHRYLYLSYYIWIYTFI